jgi:hypothetical protein
MKKKCYSFILLFTFLLCCLHVYATRIVASSLGFNATDATIPFRAAINTNVDTVIIDNVGSDWFIQPTRFFDISNRVIIFQPGVNLVAKPGAYTDPGACLFELIRATNITMIGYDVVFKMQKAEILNGEFRHTISLNRSKQIAIYGIWCKDSGGDGIFLGGYFPGTFNYCEDIIIKDCIFDNHLRQGMSIISAQNVKVSNCKFINTVGTLPEYGVDLEPDSPTERMVNVVFSECEFSANNGSGVGLAFFNLDSNSLPVSVSFNDCLIRNNHTTTNAYYECEINANAKDSMAVRGFVNFNRCVIGESKWSALKVRKPTDSYQIGFNDCAMNNVSTLNTPYNAPIWIETPNYSLPVGYFGNIVLNNCLIKYPTNFPYLWIYGSSVTPGVKDVTGTLTIINPFTPGIQIDNCAQTVNVQLTANRFTSVPLSNVSISPVNTSAYERNCNQTVFRAARASSDNLSFPLPVYYSTTGTAEVFKDYSFKPGFKILSPNIVNATDTIRMLADDIVESTESININLLPNSLYNNAATTLNTTLLDGSCGVLPVTIATVQVQAKNCAVEIAFTTASESNLDRFVILHSTDGLQFAAVGFVKANNQASNYSFIHRSTFVATNYYAIQSINKDGTSTTSKQYVVKNVCDANNVTALFAYPNPASQFLFVQAQTKINKANCSISNALGQQINLPNVQQVDAQSIKLNVASLPTGLYFFKIDNQTIRFLKQ